MELTVIVATSGMASDRPDLRGEVALCRSAVLYADRVVLLSPTAVEVERAVARTRQMSIEDLKAILAEKLPDHYAALLQSGDLEADLSTIRARVAEAQLAGAPALDELQVGIRSGLIEWRRTDEAESHESFTETLGQLLRAPGTHAVCDELTGELIAALRLRDQSLSAGTVSRRHREAEVGGGLIARIPAFPTAPLDELLDLKKELQDPLTRYRGAVAALEDQLSLENSFAAVASGELDAEIDRVFRRSVAPAIADLHKLLEEHSLVRELARSLGTTVRDLILSGASLSMALATVAEVTASVSAAAGILGGTTQAAASAAWARRSARQQAQAADFYYLYRIGELASQRA